MSSPFSKILLLLVVICLFTVSSCGKKKTSSMEAEKNESSSTPLTPPHVNQPSEGNYRVVLLPVNPSIDDDVEGTAVINIEGETVEIKVNLINARQGIHKQFIQTGTNCEDIKADLNDDKLIDAAEARASYGSVLIPLDSNIEEQMTGTFPMANSTGSYRWNKSTSLSRLMADLLSPDPIESDSMVKLSPGEEINLAGKVLVVYGVKASESIPESVAGVDEVLSREDIPVACGTIHRIEPQGIEE